MPTWPTCLNEAALLTARQNDRMITNLHMDEAIDRVIAGPQKRSRLMNERDKLITAYHEGGHALVAAALPGTDPVQKVTILPRGRALGYTMVLPEQDKYANTRAELLDQLAYMMGGRAAEELVFHDPTTGASNDIEKATNVARAMVTQYGMTERIGAVKLGTGDAEPFLGRDFGHQRDYSEDIAAIVDEEVVQADQQRPPGGVRHPHREPRRAGRAGAGAVREGDPGPGRGGGGLPAAQAVAEAAGLDRLGHSGAVADPAGHPAAAGAERPERAHQRTGPAAGRATIRRVVPRFRRVTRRCRRHPPASRRACPDPGHSRDRRTGPGPTGAGPQPGQPPGSNWPPAGPDYR